ncbi:N-acetyltransferase [Amycolatopsis taiwanensis]|uniref:N-acetyltransferase n=1 Tax=Amycolatopsis taiwanensis TaxID=342230 RepID=A0A9W6R672_9PSEU|nr:N-acetyltransferase [Amycolatopsis taiwanensis]GLY68185.1 N-acetyltransferase [Amycolatopsis taiwanensis]
MSAAPALPHPLLPVFLAAADAAFPPADGQVIFMPAPQKGMHAIVSFTGHAIVATSLPATDFAEFDLDGFGSALEPGVLQRLAGPGGEIGVLDVTLVRHGQGGGSGLPMRDDLDHHPRVLHARRLRSDVRVHGDDRGLITIASGLAGRTEMSVELHHPDSSDGAGRALIHEALRLVPAGEPVFAAVAPGNARSLRAFLASGFRPISSEVIITTDSYDPASTATREASSCSS